MEIRRSLSCTLSVLSVFQNNHPVCNTDALTSSASVLQNTLQNMHANV